MPQIQIPRTRPYIHQGPTVQQTHPVPGVSLPQPAMVIAQLAQSRYQVPATVYRHQGATVQATFPVPPVTVRDVSRWRQTDQDPNRLALGSGNVGPDPQLDGATVQQTHPLPARVEMRLAPRVPQPPLAFPQPVAVVAPVDTIGHQFDMDQQPWRYVATKQPAPIVLPHDEAAFIFTPTSVVQPFAAILRPQPRQTPQTDGPTVQDWFLYPAGQPDRARYALLQTPRFLVTTIRPVEGPTVQDWFVYLTNQPDLNAYAVLQRVRRLGGPSPQLDGPLVVEHTLTYRLSQPMFVLRASQPVLAFPQDIAAVAVLDTLFGVPPNQPELARFALLQALRFVVPATRDVHQGPTQQDTSLFPLGQPNWPTFLRTIVTRAQLPTTLPVDGVPPVVDASFSGSPPSWTRVGLPLAPPLVLTSPAGWLTPSLPPTPPGTAPKIILVNGRLAIRLHGFLYELLG